MTEQPGGRLDVLGPLEKYSHGDGKYRLEVMQGELLELKPLTGIQAKKDGHQL